VQIAVIGGGNMGLAFARGIAGSDDFAEDTIYIVEPSESRQKEILELRSFTVCGSIAELPDGCEVVFLAVKPQIVRDLYPDVQRVLSDRTVVISVMAGITVDEMVRELSHPAVVRAMPNLPARIGRGVTVAFQAPGVTEGQAEVAQKVLSSAGAFIAIDKEEMLDAATAVSGSGPGFVFYLIEHFQKAALELGFSKKQSELLVRETFYGALSLLEGEGTSAEKLRKQVTSKGGTTEAGIKSFQDSEVGLKIVDGVTAAYERCRELGK
jgi:pyrroline-5-carboxylate reductase